MSTSTTNSWGGYNDGIARSWNPSKNSSYASKLYFKWNDGSFTNDTGFNIEDGRTEKWGNYYNWFAAVAGTGGTNTPLRKVMEESICPAGFKLPTAIDSVVPGAFYYLFITTYKVVASTNDTGPVWTAFMYPLSFVPTGYYRANGSLYNLNREYTYWANMTDVYPSASRYGHAMTFKSHFDSTNYINPGYYGDMKGNGFSIRCVSQ